MLLAGAFDQLNSIMNSFAPDNPARFTGVGSFVSLLANVFIVIAVGLSIVALAFGFIQMATSTGDIKNAERAQRTLLWGAIGIVISLLAYALKTVLFNAAGISGVL